jgi:hypothetical protein
MSMESGSTPTELFCARFDASTDVVHELSSGTLVESHSLRPLSWLIALCVQSHTACFIDSTAVRHAIGRALTLSLSWEMNLSMGLTECFHAGNLVHVQKAGVFGQRGGLCAGYAG